jgi:hypothetical protein
MDQMTTADRPLTPKMSSDLASSLDAVASTRRTAKAITSDNDYFIRDTYADDYYDTYAVPGLIGASIAVPRTNASTLLGVGMLDTYSSGYMTTSGGAGLLIDANADGLTDYMALTPDSYMSLDTGYTTAITKKVGSSWVSTGQTAMWLRSDDYYGVALEWKGLGIKDVRWTFGIIDSAGDTDYAPDQYATPVDLAYGQAVTPPPPSGGGAVTSLPAKVGKLSVTKRKGRTSVSWPKAAGATSYQVKVSTNGSKYKTWGKTRSSKATISTKSGKAYSVAVRAKNSVGYGQFRYKSFAAR